MPRRIVAIGVWLLAVAMTAAWVWVIVEGAFMASMLAELPVEEQWNLTQGWWIVAYAAMAGLVVLTVANATVGLLLASRPGGGRIGAILLFAGLATAALPFGNVVGGTLAQHDPLNPMASALFLIGPTSYAFAFALILPVVALVFPDGRLPSPRWRLVSDHRFNRATYDAERMATGFAGRLRDEVDLNSVSGDIAGTAEAALHPTTIDVWIRRARPTTP